MPDIPVWLRAVEKGTTNGLGHVSVQLWYSVQDDTELHYVELYTGSDGWINQRHTFPPSFVSFSYAYLVKQGYEARRLGWGDITTGALVEFTHTTQAQPVTPDATPPPPSSGGGVSPSPGGGGGSMSGALDDLMAQYPTLFSVLWMALVLVGLLVFMHYLGKYGGVGW